MCCTPKVTCQGRAGVMQLAAARIVAAVLMGGVFASVAEAAIIRGRAARPGPARSRSDETQPLDPEFVRDGGASHEALSRYFNGCAAGRVGRGARCNDSVGVRRTRPRYRQN